MACRYVAVGKLEVIRVIQGCELAQDGKRSVHVCNASSLACCQDITAI